MRRKLAVVLIVICLFIIIFSINTSAEKIIVTPPIIELESKLTSPISYQIQGDTAVELRGLGAHKQLKIDFSATNHHVEEFMRNNLFFQFRLNDPDWDEDSWIPLRNLPIILESSDLAAIRNGYLFLAFKVPQVIDLSRGLYEGSLILEILKKN